MRGIGSMKRVFELIEREPQMAHGGERLEHVKGNIQFEKISFNFPTRPDARVLDEFSLEIPAGKVMAIVGSSGSGKSTVASLITRLYDPCKGRVLLDGKDISKSVPPNQIKSIQINPNQTKPKILK